MYTTCCCSFSDVAVEEVRQGLLAHSVIVRDSAGERIITFDQWAQLFDWVSHRLDIADDQVLQRRLGVDVGVT